MRRSGWVALLAVAVLVLSAVPSAAGGRWHGHVVIGGPVWAPAYYPYWWYPRPYYVYPPTVIVQEPLEYVEREPAPPAPPPAPAAPPAYWHYCESARAYYPSVPSCPEPWIKVPARRP